jgi:hypothetical protein
MDDQQVPRLVSGVWELRPFSVIGSAGKKGRVKNIHFA